ncbi:MAG: MBL fold metallo-hydrolase, partial [Vulcanimicrobiaceae bacterium]
MQAQRAKALDALALAQTRLQLDGQDDTAKEIGDLLTSFFGVTGGSSTTAAMDAVRGLSKDLHYREPSDPPWVPPDTSVRLYVLGPPRDETLLKKASVAASSPEVYGIDSSSTYMTFVVPALQAEDPDAPFDAMQVIPMTVAETMPFFRQRYWGSN